MHDDTRLVWLFGKPYYWHRTDGQLHLKHVIVSTRPARDPLDVFRGPLPWPPQ